MDKVRPVGDLRERAKRNIKDSVFTHLFKDPKYTIQLYRALHPEDVTSTEADVRILTLENILTDQPYNDLGFSIGNHLMVFLEAQSTWSINIVVRGLIYIARTLQVYLKETNQNVYGSKKVQFPFPEFYVLYTGERKAHPERISLKEEFFDGRIAAIDATATMIYDGEEGDIINQYLLFTQVFQEQYKLYGDTQKAVLETIRICKSKNVLKEYLTNREKEVIDIMTWLYDQEYITDLYAQEQREIGRAEGIAEGEARGRAEGEAKGRAEGEAKGRAEGVERTSRETARKLYTIGMMPNQIANIVNYGVDTICQWLGLPLTGLQTQTGVQPQM